NGSDGGDGVYQYGSTAFPKSTYLASNYWVDVVFKPDTASPMSNASPASALRARIHQSEVPSLSCSPRAVRAGDNFYCELTGMSMGATAKLDVRGTSNILL